MVDRKDHEKQVLSHFTSYETTRDFIEQLSITKHYERIGFAFLGIKDEFNDLPLSDIFAQKWTDLLVLVVFTSLGIIADYYTIYRKDALFRG